VSAQRAIMPLRGVLVIDGFMRRKPLSTLDLVLYVRLCCSFLLVRRGAGSLPIASESGSKAIFACRPASFFRLELFSLISLDWPACPYTTVASQGAAPACPFAREMIFPPFARRGLAPPSILFFSPRVNIQIHDSFRQSDLDGPGPRVSPSRDTSKDIFPARRPA